MVQLENEVGLIGDSRDRSALANEAFAKPVPKELTDYLQAHKDSLLPETRKVWEAAGAKTSGTWEQVFGAGPGRADEVFMAWNYSRYIGKVAEAGKAEYPVPMYVNAWIVQPEDKGPGDYPSGGPQAHMHDIWRAGGPQIDMLSPDIYLPEFNELADRYSRERQPALHSRVVRHRGGRGQRVLRHRAAQRHRLLAHGHRSAHAADRVPAGNRSRGGHAHRRRQPPVPQGLQGSGAAQPPHSGAPGEGHDWGGLAQQGSADEGHRAGRLHGERQSHAQSPGSRHHSRGRVRHRHRLGAG